MYSVYISTHINSKSNERKKKRVRIWYHNEWISFCHISQENKIQANELQSRENKYQILSNSKVSEWSALQEINILSYFFKWSENNFMNISVVMAK